LVDLEMSDGQAIGQLTNNGEILFDPRLDTRLLAQGIENNGTFWTTGSIATPHAADFTIDLCGPRPTSSGNPGGGPLRTGLTHTGNTSTGNNGTTNDNFGVSRGFINNPGGIVKLYAQGPAIHRLNAHGTAGATTLTIDPPLTVAQPAGARLVVTPTHLFTYSLRTEEFTLAAPAAVGATSITINTGLGYARWGRMQYATNLGPSLTADPFTDGSSNSYVGSISGTTMTITSATGTISIGEMVNATGMNLAQTYVLSQLSGTTGGVGQYLLSQSQTVAPGSAITCKGMRADASQNPEIDERAFVCFLSSTGRIRGYDCGNTSLADFGFGFHGMSMGLTSETVISGVQMIDYGQKGLLGRYAWHFHQPSYNADGTIKTDGIAGSSTFSQTASPLGPNYPANKALVTGCSFDTGHNRAFVFHACRGVVATSNIAYKSFGHAFFEEDGSEEDNTSQDNVAIRAVTPTSSADALKTHESDKAAGHWMANFRNVHKDNWAVDCSGVGFWNAANYVPGGPAGGCLGFSVNVPIWPFHTRIATWDGVTAFSCAQGGDTGLNPYNNQGNVYNAGFEPRSDDTPNGTIVASLFNNIRLFKCGMGQGVISADLGDGATDRAAYFNRLNVGGYVNPRVADNRGPSFQGAVQIGTNEFGIAFGYTLNVETVQFRQFAASYHGLMLFKNSSYFNFSGTTAAYAPGFVQGPGVLATWDLYTDPLQPWSKDMPGWRMYNSLGCWQTPGPALLSDTTTYDTYLGGHHNEITGWPVPYKWHLGIIYDHYGNLSTSPGQVGVAGSHIVFNQPFITTGISTVPLIGNTESCVTAASLMGMSVEGHDPPVRYGMNLPAAVNRASWMNACAMRWQRCDSTRTAISGAIWDSRDSFDNQTYDLGDAGYQTYPSGFWGTHSDMWAGYFWGNKHVMWPVGSVVRYSNPNYTPVTYIFGRIWHAGQAINPNANDTTDYCYVGFPIVGTRTVSVCTHGGHNYTAIGSWALLQAAAPNTRRYWFDTANNELWMKFDGTTVYDNTFSNFEITTV
jgi:hypothetical protein